MRGETVALEVQLQIVDLFLQNKTIKEVVYYTGVGRTPCIRIRNTYLKHKYVHRSRWSKKLYRTAVECVKNSKVP